MSFKKQQGFMLVMSLIFLVVLTVLGSASLNTSTVSEKAAYNSRNLTVSFQSAESGLRDGEKWVKNSATIPLAVASCNTTPCDVWETAKLPDFLVQNDAWWQANGRTFSSSLGVVDSEPRHFIEQVNFIPDDLSVQTQADGVGVYFYQITSRGVGSSSNAESIIQSTFTTRFN